MGENKSIAIIVGVMVTKGGQHLAGAEGGAGARGARRVADADRIVLGKCGGGPRDVVSFMLGGVRTEVEDSSPEKGANDGLLEWRDDAGVDRGGHEAILNGVEAVGENVVVARDAHVTRDSGRCLVC